MANDAVEVVAEDANGGDGFYVAVPMEVRAELVEGKDATARSAPGVRVDVGAAVDAVRVALEVSSGLTTMIVGAPQLKAFCSQLARALRRHGATKVSVDSSASPEQREPGEAVGGDTTGGPSVIDVSDEQLYRELIRRLAAPAAETTTPVSTPTQPVTGLPAGPDAPPRP